MLQCTDDMYVCMVGAPRGLSNTNYLVELPSQQEHIKRTDYTEKLSPWYPGDEAQRH